MERELINIETPIGKVKIVLKKWLTGREQRAISQVFLRNAEFISGVDGKQTTKSSINGDLINESQDMAIKTVIVSVNGSAENILDAILDLHSQDYEFIVQEINKVTTPEKDSKNRG